MADEMTSRERMLGAMNHASVDHIPLCFMIFAAMKNRSRDGYDFVERQLEMGLDATVGIPTRPLDSSGDHRDLPGLPVSFHPDVGIREWREERPGESHPVVLHKEYQTPAGTLTTEVNMTDDWPYGDHVPFFDDYLCPRSRKFLVEGREDLDALRYLLVPPSDDEVEAFRRQAEEDRDFADGHGLLTTGGRGVGMDATAWLCGFRHMAISSIRQPAFVAELAEIIHEWNCHRMRVFLDGGVDLFMKRGWYEGTDFWSPALFRKFILPHLRREVQIAHDAGTKFGLIMTSGSMPLLEMLADADLDVLIGVDPVQGKGTDMPEMKRRLGGRVCLWGGVNGFITVETGTRAQVSAAVEEAVRAMGPRGFILSPVDNVRDDSPKAWENIGEMIETWKRVR